jgi:hypothetical protein
MTRRPSNLYERVLFVPGPMLIFYVWFRFYVCPAQRPDGRTSRIGRGRCTRCILHCESERGRATHAISSSLSLLFDRHPLLVRFTMSASGCSRCSEISPSLGLKSTSRSKSWRSCCSSSLQCSSSYLLSETDSFTDRKELKTLPTSSTSP